MTTEPKPREFYLLEAKEDDSEAKRECPELFGTAWIEQPAFEYVRVVEASAYNRMSEAYNAAIKENAQFLEQRASLLKERDAMRARAESAELLLKNLRLYLGEEKWKVLVSGE